MPQLDAVRSINYYAAMDISLYVRGLILGFSIAAPVGPIGVLCIRRTLSEGRLSGFFSGLGAATADGLYGAVAAFGLTLITNALVAQQYWLQLFGGLFLAYLGIRTLLSTPAQEAANAQSGRTLLAAYTSTFLLTITNPLTILAFTAMFLGISPVTGNPAQAAMLVLGVFSGSAIWWFVLSGVVASLRQRFSPTALIWVNRTSGVIIIIFAIAILGNLMKG
jgi:threonine/homoserine/homoserine lactone efflux protein